MNFEEAGSWPLQQKIMVFALIVLFILGMTYAFFIREKLSTLESLESQETSLRADFEAKQREAANLEALKEQLEQMQVLLQKMLKQLPSKTEMPDLIVDISQAALGTGIDNQLFQPKEEVKKEFYAETPIELRMVGTFHQFGKFVSDVASLRRVIILTMHDMSLKPVDREKNSSLAPGSLMMKGTIKTYRYMDEDEAPAEGGIE